ncbi:glycoside hydrolase family 36 protein [Microbacterium jejuense]|uniref:glycoside hydrolase family 36 protein n=1 Tax=Microbacterium jejuense TaxID=1263637 RepID=UPI0031ED2E99
MTAATTATTPLDLTRDAVRVTVSTGEDAPAALTAISIDGQPSAVLRHPLVEVFTSRERHDRMTLGYVGSTIGTRLRVVEVAVDDTGSGAVVAQLDPDTGLRIETVLEVVDDGIRLSHRAINTGDREIVLFALPTLSVRTSADPAALTLVSGRGEWLGEGRWVEQSVAELLPELGFAAVAQPDRTGYGQSSSGGWSTGSGMPTALLVAADGTALAWQIESSAGWQWSLSRGDGGVVVSAGGPTEREHQAEVRLAPGTSAETVPAALVVSGDGRDGAFGGLTRLRRRLRAPHLRPVEHALPVVYNDYMNTLMGQPSTEALLPLIAAASRAGAEYFCIDAGWFTDRTDYWSWVGEWQDAPNRFTGGLGAVIDAIRSAGMVPGIWLEPESVGLDSAVADALPADAFFQRYGEPVIEQRRKHLDLRHPAARAHLDRVVDRLVAEYGIGYLKLDYNIEPGSGTDVGALAPGQGLLGHTRALRDWLVSVQQRHPHLLLENCASGAMRSDYHLLAVTHLQSTSDQQDALRYAAIAASAPASVLPEQSGNWAYPAAGMSDGERAVTLVSGLSGRLYLAGFLDRLDAAAFADVARAVSLARSQRSELAEALPFWPLGLPQWDAAVITLGRRLPSGDELLHVWSRGEGRELRLAGSTITQEFGIGAPWVTAAEDETVRILVPTGPDAAVFRITRH